MNNPVLVTMRGPSRGLDVRTLSNFEAGIAALSLIGRIVPGLTFGQMAAMVDRPDTMRGWWTDLKGAAGDVKDGIGDVLKSTANFVGGSVGDSVRLVASESVIDGASRLGAAYATGGGSEGVRTMLGGSNSGNSTVDSLINFVSSLGENIKAKADVQAASAGTSLAGVPVWVWGIGGVLVVWSLVGSRRR